MRWPITPSFPARPAPPARALGVAALAWILAGCPATPASPPTPAPPPDYLDVQGHRVVAQVWTDPARLPAPLFSPLPAPARLLVYPYPQLGKLDIPPDGRVWDVAFFDVGGRALAVYPKITCPGPGACQPLSSPFPAAWVLLARPGTIEGVNLKTHGALRWAKPAIVQPPRALALSSPAAAPPRKF